MNFLERIYLRGLANAIRLVRRTREERGWYAAANVVMGAVSLGFGLVCLMMYF